MELIAKKIFNEFGSDTSQDKMLVGGNSTGIMNLNSIKYQWATKLNRIMINNFWLPEKVSLVEDKVTIKELTVDEMKALKNTLSFLIALDSMQVTNLPNLADYITAPEVSAIFTIQAYQELIHSQSYQYILNELFSTVEREEIYNYWRTNPKLLERNKLIANKYQQFIDDKSEMNFKKAIVANFALEGIYFYAGFNFFYQLASRNKASGVSSIIKYIEIDEVTHVDFFKNIILELFDMSNKDDVAIIRDIMIESANEEIEWAWDNYGDRILGISKKSSEEYIKYLANIRAKLLGIGVLFHGCNQNPYQYLNSKKKQNFFETTVTEYSQSSAVSGWDDF